MASVYFTLQSQQKSLLQINIYKLIRLLTVYKYSYNYNIVYKYSLNRKKLIYESLFFICKTDIILFLSAIISAIIFSNQKINLF